MISLIVAMDKNHVIGKDNKIPWSLPADLAYFKKVTMGNTVIMGRKTFESIGRPLPGRQNVVITRNNNYTAEGCIIYNSIEDALETAGSKDVFIIGGANIYREFLPYANRLYITLIEECFLGDTYFPEINYKEWKLTSKTKGERDDKNPYNYYFLTYERE